MSAKEMFEELGYEQKTSIGVIYYFKKIHIPKNDIVYNINFITDLINGEKEIFISKNIDMQELKAINKQIEELGWLNE